VKADIGAGVFERVSVLDPDGIRGLSRYLRRWSDYR
jgi:hypothetical protein